MKKVYAVVLMLWAAALVGAQEVPESGADQSRLLAMENAWNQAVQTRDIKALELLLGPELVYVDYDGKLMSREQYLNKIGIKTARPQQVMNESMTVHIYGTVAVVSGVYREKGTQDGKPYLHRERFTDTWVNRHGTWMCVAIRH
jgi:ketosteroid isomerase-like protein